MNGLMSDISIACFVALPPLMLWLRLRRGKPSWWIVAPALVLIGWAGWLGATVFYFESLGDRIQSLQNPPIELIDKRAADGGPKVFALVFGWAIAAIYSTAWYLVLLVLGLVRRRSAAPRREDKLEIRILDRNAILSPDDRK